jgi:hypothetical protein
MAENTSETVGHGASIAYGTAASFTVLSDLYDLKPNAISVAEVVTTKLNSATATSQPGTPDFGEVTATIPYNFTTSNLVQGWITAKTVQNYKLAVDDFTTASSQTFVGWIKTFEPMSGDLQKDEPAKANITIRITGAGTLTTGT